MLVVSNQQESKVPHGVRTFANQSTIHGETGSMKFNLKIVAATAAVAMMSSGAAMAQAVRRRSYRRVLISTRRKVSRSSGDEALTLPDVQVTFGNNLTNNDDIFITLPGVTSLPFTPSNLNMVCSVAGNAVGYVTTVNGGWNFRVSAVAGFSIGDTCTFSGLEVESASLANSNGDLVYEARRQAGGTLVDQRRQRHQRSPS